MNANYHTHTWRCNHAQGTEREYVENAIQAGLHTLGFSDHGPYIFPGDYYSGYRMTMKNLDNYVETLLALRREFEGQIQIPIGLELEYYPDLMPKLLPVLRDNPIDYLLLGQHFLGNEIGDPYAAVPTDDKRLLVWYCDQTIDALQTGLFTYFAHPDLIRYRGDEKFYVEQMRRICREANACGLPLEINLLGVAENRHYPNLRFLETAAEENCTMIFGRDAHTPQAILDQETEDRARELAGRFGLKVTDTVTLRKP